MKLILEPKLLREHEQSRFVAHPIKLPIQNYNFILGMNWLYQHQAVLDCFAKSVKLGREDEVGTDANSQNSVK